MSGETPAIREALAVYAPEDPETDRVPSGYKQTEVGVIPEDWEVAYLSDLVASGPRNGYSGRSGKDARGTPTLSLTATSAGHLVLKEETVKRLYEIIDSRSDLFLKPGDLLVQRSNTLDLVGTTAVFNGPPEVYVYPDLMMRLRFKDNATGHWFWRYANSADGRRYFVSIAAGSTGSMPKISGEKLRKIPLPVPSLPEQRAIAAALSNVDALISALDKLIAKKRAVKTAAMQQLLTGKQRLPGFSGEWEMKRLGEVCQIISGGTPSTSVPAFWTGEIPWCTPTDITDDTSKYLYKTNRTISEDGLKHSSAVLLPPGSLLLCTRATVGEIKIAATPVCTNQGFKSLVCGRDVSNEFLFYKLVMLKGRLRELGVGSTFLEVSRRDVAALEIPLPKFGEQIAIATVLSDMDVEIEVLEARREKTRRIKQGMMQELLTGRARLV